MKICPVEDEFFHADGRTDGHGEPNLSFRNFVNAPEKSNKISQPEICLFITKYNIDTINQLTE